MKIWNHEIITMKEVRERNINTLWQIDFNDVNESKGVFYQTVEMIDLPWDIKAMMEERTKTQKIIESCYDLEDYDEDMERDCDECEELCIERTECEETCKGACVVCGRFGEVFLDRYSFSVEEFDYPGIFANDIYFGSVSTQNYDDIDDFVEDRDVKYVFVF